jgi:copper chaperone
VTDTGAPEKETATVTVRSTYTVVGMTCGHCVQAVTTELTKVPGVHGVEIELTTGEVSVDSDGPVSIDAVRAAVDEAGYALAGTHA